MKKKNGIITDEQAVEIVKKRGRPKGTGGNTRKDLSWSGNENLKPGDNTRYLRHALATMNLPPIDIADPKQVEERILWYFSHCASDDMKPTVSGMANALGVSRDTLWDWSKGNNRVLTHRDLIKRAYQALSELWEDYMLNGKINPVAGIFIGKNHFGYRDQTEVVLMPNDPLGEAQDKAALERKYQEALPPDET